jgi:hypothetical protein
MTDINDPAYKTFTFPPSFADVIACWALSIRLSCPKEKYRGEINTSAMTSNVVVKNNDDLVAGFFIVNLG